MMLQPVRHPQNVGSLVVNKKSIIISVDEQGARLLGSSIQALLNTNFEHPVEDGTVILTDKHALKLEVLQQKDHFNIYLRDATSRFRLQQRMELFMGVIDTVSEAMLITDASVTGLGPNIVFSNRAMCALSGYSLQQLKGQPLAVLQNGNLDPEVLGQFQAALLTGASTADETINCHKDGTSYTVEWSASPVRDEAGEIQYFISFQRDITEKIYQIDMFKKEIDQDKELLALKDRFIATLSHEFRVPLAIIRNTVYLLKSYSHKLSPENRRAKIATIDDQICQMLEMLDDVVTISRDGMMHPTVDLIPIDIETFCRDILNSTKMADGSAAHQFMFVHRRFDRSVVTDPNLLQHILVNLLSNAIKYSPDGGQIRFEVFKDHESVHFRVCDEGIGISQAEQQHLFSQFFRGSNTSKFRGLGLGLAIAKTYVAALKGIISLTSTEGEGTYVDVLLPLVEQNVSMQ